MEREPNILGFMSAEDFLESFFRFKNWILNGTGALIASTTTFITGYMWDTEEAVYTLWILMGADWFTGIGKSVKMDKFDSYKVWRMPIYFVITSFIISISWWMAKNNVIFIPLPAIVMGGMYMVYFSSLLENLAELEWLPRRAILFLRKFGMKVIIKKYFENEQGGEITK